MKIRPRLSVMLLGLTTLWSVVGCAEFLHNGRSIITQEAKLPKMKAPLDAVEIEVLFVERPLDDALLDWALWQEVDQIGALDPIERQKMSKEGFRIGIAGSNPPKSLQALLGLSDEEDFAANWDQAQTLNGRRLYLRSGAATEIQTSEIYPECTIQVEHAKDESAKDFQHARCLFRVTVERQQDGWVKLKFLPEIHYGEQKVRPRATQGGWHLRTTQQVHPFYQQQFELTLNLGEMAAITSTGEKSNSLGSQFFIGNNENQHTQRLLVVRLANMGNRDGIYSD